MAKKDTFMSGPANPNYPRSPLIEAARFLSSQARLFALDRALAADVDAAIEEWRAAKATAGAEYHDPYMCHEEPCLKCEDALGSTAEKEGT